MMFLLFLDDLANVREPTRGNPGRLDQLRFLGCVGWMTQFFITAG